MTKRNSILFGLAVLAIVLLSFGAVSSQDVDVDHMDNEQLTVLLMQIMQRLDQSGKTAETPEPTPTPVPTPTSIPQPELSDDKAELEALMMAIMQKLEQEEDPAVEAETPDTSAAATAVPAADTEAIEEVMQITVYENKKMMVEALPGYMFIQPTEPAKSGPEQDKGSEHHNGDVCGTDEWGFPCHWYLKLDGSYNCECGNG